MASSAPTQEPTKSLDDVLRSLVEECVAKSHADLIANLQQELAEYRKAADLLAAGRIKQLETRIENQRKALTKILTILATFFHHLPNTVDYAMNTSFSRLDALEVYKNK